MMLSVRNQLGPKKYGCSMDCDLGAFVKSVSEMSVAPGPPGRSRSPRCCSYCNEKLEETVLIQTGRSGARVGQLVGVFGCSRCGEQYMHERCRLKFEKKNGLERQYMVCSHGCEAEAKQELSTVTFQKNLQVMALGMDPKIDGSLLDTPLDVLERARLRMARQPVCPGARVLWIRCVHGQTWFDDGFLSSVVRKAALQRVIGVSMLVKVVQIMESKTRSDPWDFLVIISSTTRASISYLCQKKVLVVKKPGKGGEAHFLVETGSHPAFASHMVEVRVRSPQRPAVIQARVAGLIESMQSVACTKGDEDSGHLKALKGLLVWTVPLGNVRENDRKDTKCLLAVSTLKGTIALLRYGYGFDRWAYINPLWGVDGAKNV
jgi:hypothetical protein